MQKLKNALVWVLFTLCLSAAFGLGYFVRGTVGDDTVSYVTTQAAQATAAQTTAAQTTTPTEKPEQTASTAEKTISQATSADAVTYILNTSSEKIHCPSCRYAKNISDKNRGEHTGDYSVLLAQGYTLCGVCFK